jgi:hypothetical protein
VCIKHIFVNYCIHGDIQIVEYLLDFVNIPIQIDILEHVVIHGSTEILSYLYNKLYNFCEDMSAFEIVDFINMCENLLYYSILTNRVDNFMFLISKPNILDGELLESAVEQNNFIMIQELLKNECPYPNTIWTSIALYSDIKVLKLFIEYGYILNSSDKTIVENCNNYNIIQYISIYTKWFISINLETYKYFISN